MATRPAGNPPIWGQTTNYPAGADPWSGMATKVTAPTAVGVGFTPETGIVAEYANAEFNVYSTWVEWLSFGSNAAGLDAHVMETDATGVSRIAGAIIGGTAAAFSPFVATANSGASGTVISATNNLGGFAVLASVNGGLAAVRGVTTGAGSGIEGLAAGGGGAAGVIGQGDSAGAGVVGTGGATGEGGTFVGGATSGSGVSGTAVGSFFGVNGISSATSAGAGGVLGTATRNDSAGVAGFALVAGANPLLDSTAGVVGIAIDATGVFGKSSNGYGVTAWSVNTVRAALRIVPQANDPIAPLQGDVWFNTAEDRLKTRVNAFNAGLWATRRGYSYAYAENLAQISTVATTFQTVATSTFTAQTEPIAGAILTFTVAFEMGCSVIALGAASEFEWRVLDVTDGAATPIAARLESSHVASATDADERYVTAKAQYTAPLSGARTFQLEFRSISGPPAVRIRRAVMEITGSHG